jgi:hypothetical protein
MMIFQFKMINYRNVFPPHHEIFFLIAFHRELDTSLDQLVKEVMDEIEKDTSVKSEKKSTKLEKKGGPVVNRGRGVWRKVKRPVDGFETAETINIGKHLFNSVGDGEKQEGEKPRKEEEEVIPTTIKSVIESEITTIKPSSVDVLTTTPASEHTRMFDDARKAFTEYLSLEEETDDAVNMEEADDRLIEALKELTTTTQVPATEEPIITTLPPTNLPSTEAETKKPQIISKETKKQVKTSTKQKVTGEICFRGRCIKTEE